MSAANPAGNRHRSPPPKEPHHETNCRLCRPAVHPALPHTAWPNAPTVAAAAPQCRSHRIPIHNSKTATAGSSAPTGRPRAICISAANKSAATTTTRASISRSCAAADSNAIAIPAGAKPYGARPAIRRFPRPSPHSRATFPPASTGTRFPSATPTSSTANPCRAPRSARFWATPRSRTTPPSRT